MSDFIMNKIKLIFMSGILLISLNLVSAFINQGWPVTKAELAQASIANMIFFAWFIISLIVLLVVLWLSGRKKKMVSEKESKRRIRVLNKNNKK